MATVTESFKKVVLAATLLLLPLAMAGCSEPQEAVDAAIVIQNTSGTPVWDCSVLDGTIEQVRESNGRITVTIADANPTAKTFDFSTVSDSEINKDRMERQVREYLQTNADDPGCDMLQSVVVGADSVAGSNQALGVYVIGSGISDTGLLDMASSELVDNGDPSQVAQYYAAINEVPDLSWVPVITWYGFGSTSGSQPAPSNAQLMVIEALYTEVFEECGCPVAIQAVPVATAEMRPNTLPVVKIVKFAPVVPYSVPNDKTDAGPSITEFSSTQLGFVGDSVEFLDQSQANQALSGIAELLKSDQTLVATVTCSAASYPWEEGYSQRLSEQRAEAVCSTLIAMGVDKGQLTSIGVGSGELDDIDPSTGLQDPVKAAEKRKTVIEISKAA